MYKTIALGAEPYLEATEFSAIKVGDTIALRNSNNPSWGSNNRHEVEGVGEDEVSYQGAWYRKADGWAVEILITPETVERKEPYERDWYVAVSSHGSSRTGVVVRNVHDAAAMLDLQDVAWHKWEYGGDHKMKKIAGFVSWDIFARIGKTLGLELIDRLTDPFYKAALNSVKGRSFYDAGDEWDAVQSAFQLSGCEHFGFLLECSLQERVTYWFLSLALYPDGVLTEKYKPKDVVMVIDAIGQDNFLDFAAREMPFEEMKSFAQEIINNDIDTELVTAISYPQLPDNVEWM